MIITIPQIQVFFFIIARVAGIFIQAPILSSRSFPTLGKTALAIWISLILWFVTPIKIELMPQNLIGFVLALTTEVMLGFTIGFACNIIFLSIQSAGELIDLQMGLSVAQSFDPVFGGAVSIMGRALFFTGIVIFFAVDGHHLFLSILNQSFNMIPAPAVINLASPSFITTLMGLGATLLNLSIKLAIPAILVIFISDFCFGIVSRVAPQVNVFMLGFQVKPSLGLLTLFLIMPLLVKQIASLLGIMGEEALKLLLALKIA